MSVRKEDWPTSTAAGAYQITCTTWRGQLEGYDKPSDRINPAAVKIVVEGGGDRFTPAIQDRIAVSCIHERHALGVLRNGEIEKTVSLLVHEWTSLPGGAENSKRRTAQGGPMDIKYFMSIYDSYFEEEKMKLVRKT